MSSDIQYVKLWLMRPHRIPQDTFLLSDKHGCLAETRKYITRGIHFHVMRRMLQPKQDKTRDT